MRKLCVCLALLCLTHHASAERVWIDTDVSIGSPIREVDDAFALVLALQSPEIQIVGLSTTYGNASLGQTTRIARDLVWRFGPSGGVTVDPVSPGARSAHDMGRKSEASEALAAALQKRKVTYIALGPLTNLATFLELHPEAANRIERVIFLGGQMQGTSLVFGPTRSLRIHDANVFKDPAATKTVLGSSIPLTLIPIATAANLLVDGTDLRQLERSGDAGNYLSRRSRIWLWFWTHVVKTEGGPIFDALAIVPTARPELVTIKKGYAAMDGAGSLVVTLHPIKGGRPVRYCAGFAPETKRVVMQRLMARQSRE